MWIVSHQVKTLPALMETENLLRCSQKARHWSTSWASSFQSPVWHPVTL